MKTKRFREAYQIEVGRNNLLLTVEVSGCIYPAEPMVRYYKDGSGYPGCPAQVEFDDIWVSDVTGDFGIIDRYAHRDGWFKILDEIAQDYQEYFEAKVMESDNDE